MQKKIERSLRYLLMVGACLYACSALADADKREALFVVGQSASVAPGEEIESAIVVGGDLEVNGKVRGLAAAVGGSVHAGPGAIIDGPAASIGGELAIDALARVKGPQLHVAAGDFSQVASDLAARQKSRPPPLWAGSAIRISQILAAFVLGILLILWAPVQVRTVRDAVVTAPTRNLLLGLALVVGLAPLCVLLAVSVAGIPLIPVALLFALACFAFGLIGIGAVIGRRLGTSRGEDHLLGNVAIGMLALAAGVALPILGALILFAACVYGAGAVLATRFGTRPPTQKPPAQQSAPPSPVDTQLSQVH